MKVWFYCTASLIEIFKSLFDFCFCVEQFFQLCTLVVDKFFGRLGDKALIGKFSACTGNFADHAIELFFKARLLLVEVDELDETDRGAGGFGRESAAGIPLFDFLPARNLVMAARAMVELFSDHGDRTNRGRARIRFIRKRLGDEAFLKLYREYYGRLDPADYPAPPAVPHDWPLAGRRKTFDAVPEPDSEEYRKWRAAAVRPTRFGADTATVTLFVPRGVLSPDEFAAVADLISDFGLPAVRLTFEQNIVLPVVSAAALPPLCSYAGAPLIKQGTVRSLCEHKSACPLLYG